MEALLLVAAQLPPANTIAEAARSPLGILALVCALLAGIAPVLLKEAPWKARFAAFLLMLAAVVVLGRIALRNVGPRDGPCEHPGEVREFGGRPHRCVPQPGGEAHWEPVSNGPPPQRPPPPLTPHT
jgi:hypothetical protein